MSHVLQKLSNQKSTYRFNHTAIVVLLGVVAAPRKLNVAQDNCTTILYYKKLHYTTILYFKSEASTSIKNMKVEAISSYFHN